MDIKESTIILVPYPQKLKITGNDSITLPESSYISFKNIKPDTRITTAGKQLCVDLKNQFNFDWNVSYGDGYKSAINVSINKDLCAQEYKIYTSLANNQPRINRAIITVEAKDIQSICFAIQTIRQLIKQFGTSMPLIEIEDFPKIPVRAYSYDVSRGRIPKLSWLKILVDQLCLYKYNQLQLYVEHTIDLENTIESWIKHTPLTCSEIIELDEYCYNRGIELVPTMATFGHMYEVLRSPSYKNLGEFPSQSQRPFSFVERMLHHTFNPANPQTIPFISKRIKDYAALFRSNKFNIGADETFDLGCGESKEIAQKDGVANLYSSYVQKLCNTLQEIGSQPIMYADIALKHPNMLCAIPKNVIFANWNYAANVTEDSVKLIRNQNAQQYVCPGTQTWNRLIPDFDCAISNISKMCKYAHKNNACGLLLTDWGDYGHINDPILSLPYLIMAAQYSWGSSNISKNNVEHDFADINSLNTLLKDISNILTDNLCPQLCNILQEASHSQAFSWSDAVQFKELDDNGNSNKDVLFLLGFKKDISLKEARKQFLTDRNQQILNAEKYNNTLYKCINDLYKTYSCSKCYTLKERINKDFINTTILSIQGQQILNSLGLYILNASAEYSNSSNKISKDQVAYFVQTINNWFIQYANRWNSIGKSADLYRIRQVFDWHIDWLLKNSN